MNFNDRTEIQYIDFEEYYAMHNNPERYDILMSEINQHTYASIEAFLDLETLEFNIYMVCRSKGNDGILYILTVSLMQELKSMEDLDSILRIKGYGSEEDTRLFVAAISNRLKNVIKQKEENIFVRRGLAN